LHLDQLPRRLPGAAPAGIAALAHPGGLTLGLLARSVWIFQSSPALRPRSEGKTGRHQKKSNFCWTKISRRFQITHGMAKSLKPKRIGILTAGGDSPGLNAAIRGVGKTCLGFYGMEIIGFRDGFRGLVENSRLKLDRTTLAGILTVGGTILGTSRDKPHRMVIDGRTRDMTETIVHNYDKWGLDCIVCLGGGGTQKNALRLHQAGLNVVTLPKTIDNDVAMTDATFGYATAMDIATETIDRLHSTAHSHHRIIVAEIMGHRAGWLTLGSGIAGGADVILIPELPYDVEHIAAAIRRRSKHGTNFSIVAVAEGAMSRDDARAMDSAEKKLERAKTLHDKKEAKVELAALEVRHQGNTLRLAKQLEELTQLESRVTILGYVQRGGTPSAADRILATRLGSACGDLIHEGLFGVMVAARGDGTEPVPLEKVAGKRKSVPPDHSWVQTARHVGTCMGD
jgi:6-phosphofructokinase 1